MTPFSYVMSTMKDRRSTQNLHIDVPKQGAEGAIASPALVDGGQRGTKCPFPQIIYSFYSTSSASKSNSFCMTSENVLKR